MPKSIRSVDYLEFVFWKPVLQALGWLALGFFALLIILGGMFFWAPQLGAFFFNPNGVLPPNNQLETAQSGLRTIKRMVGNEQIWSMTIQHEYGQLFAGQDNPIYTNTNRAVSQGDPSYQNNFLETQSYLTR